jgi:hypothetical protein
LLGLFLRKDFYPGGKRMRPHNGHLLLRPLNAQSNPLASNSSTRTAMARGGTGSASVSGQNNQIRGRAVDIRQKANIILQ